MVLKWLGAIFASSLTFALADILCDVCISEKEQSSSNVADGSGEGEKMVQSAADDDDDVTVVLSHTPNTLDDGSSDSETGGNLRQRDGLNGALAGMLHFTNGARYRQLLLSRSGDSTPETRICGSLGCASDGVACGGFQHVDARRPEVDCHVPTKSDADAEPGLTGEQDTAIAGMVTVAGLL
eukprot:1597023-Pleurochrysis_carterae.AAC.1